MKQTPLATMNKKERTDFTIRVWKMFVQWCETDADFILYNWQKQAAFVLLYSLFVESVDVFMKVARQAGKTELVTLLIKFLIIFFRHWTGAPLMCGIASPKGEQAKTDVDRIKKDMMNLRERWSIEDREFNQKTVRVHDGNELNAEIYKFSLAPTTSNESKTLNLLIIEESHKADDRKRSEELDPMLMKSNGPTWHLGVGTTRLCDFKKGCDGDLPDTRVLIYDVDRCISDSQLLYEITGDPTHLKYKDTYAKEVKKKGITNLEIRRNYHLEDTVEVGNFISRV